MKKLFFHITYRTIIAITDNSVTKLSKSLISYTLCKKMHVQNFPKTTTNLTILESTFFNSYDTLQTLCRVDTWMQWKTLFGTSN